MARPEPVPVIVPDGLPAAILAWYDAGHRDLPWREERDPYRVAVSEVMLQQTQVDRVIPAYQRFLATFPTVEDLAAAPREAVIRAWAGLGYNSRAVRLHQMAAAVAKAGAWPDTLEGLQALPGIGRYTAAAIGSFALGIRAAVMDTNVRRTLGRILDGEVAPDRRAWTLADAALPDRDRDWNQALMDLGATVCTPRRPGCSRCPAAPWCRALQHHAGLLDGPARPTPRQSQPGRPFESTRRYFRGRIVDALRTHGALDRDALARTLPRNPAEAGYQLDELLAGLVRDGLVQQEGATVALA